MQKESPDKIVKYILTFVNIILVAIGYMVFRAYLAGYNPFDTKDFIDYSSTIFIQAVIIASAIVAALYFLIIRKKNGNRAK